MRALENRKLFKLEVRNFEQGKAIEIKQFEQIFVPQLDFILMTDSFEMRFVCIKGMIAKSLKNRVVDPNVLYRTAASPRLC